MQHITTPERLKTLLAQDKAVKPCDCGLGTCPGWESLSESRWPSASMTQIATLRDTNELEPTFEELHPAGTRYESPAAPIALGFFPYNRCDLWHCERCENHFLRYTEFGGYYIDHRVRQISSQIPILG